MSNYNRRISRHVYVKQGKGNVTLVVTMLLLTIFYLDCRETAEVLISIVPPRKPVTLIILQPLPGGSGSEWEDMIDIKATVEMVKGKFGESIKLASQLHEVAPEIITAVVVVESLGDPKAVSHKNAYGLMQLLIGTAHDMGITDPFHPYDNLWAGTKYLKQQWDRFGSLELALAAYNMGPARLERRLKNGFDPNYNTYIRRVETVLTYM